jgi:molecular chaperone GrpE
MSDEKKTTAETDAQNKDLEKELQDMIAEAQKAADAKDGEEQVEEEAPEKTDAEIIAELQDQLLRSQAELVNFKQRMQKEKIEHAKYAAKKTIMEIIPVLDTFTMAANHMPENLKEDNWAMGVQHILTQFLTILETLGVKKIETTGKPVDFSQHEAIQMVPGEKDLVIQEIQAGYALHGVVLRAAKVQVGSGE